MHIIYNYENTSQEKTRILRYNLQEGVQDRIAHIFLQFTILPSALWEKVSARNLLWRASVSVLAQLSHCCLLATVTRTGPALDYTGFGWEAWWDFPK